MERLPYQLRKDLDGRAGRIGTHLRRVITVRDDLDTPGCPRIWLDAQDSRGAPVPLVYLGASDLGPKHTRYTVGRPGEDATPTHFTTEIDALRAVQCVALAQGKALGPPPPRPGQRQRPTTPPASQREAPHVQDSQTDKPTAPQVPPGPQEPGPNVPMFTGDQAVNHPVIRAAIIAGHEVFRATGQAPDPVMVLQMAEAALGVVDIVLHHCPQEQDSKALVERVLVGALAGALNAASGEPHQETQPRLVVAPSR